VREKADRTTQTARDNRTVLLAAAGTGIVLLLARRSRTARRSRKGRR
jgi:hypothetical protein